MDPACLDRWMSLLLILTTPHRIVGWDDTRISGGRGEGSSRAILANARLSCIVQ